MANTMDCYLREYLNLKRDVTVSHTGSAGSLIDICFTEPDWTIGTLVADFGKHIVFSPDDIDSFEDEPPTLYLRVSNEPLRETAADSCASIDGHASANDLLGRSVISRADGNSCGRLTDLLVNVHTWRLRFFVVDNAEHAVLVDAAWGTGRAPDCYGLQIEGIPARAVRSAPAYAGLSSLTPGAVDILYRHYTRRDFTSTSSSFNARDSLVAG